MKAKKANSKVLPPQVFINFRGDELRDNFVNQLVRALREGEINVFIDVHELKGRSLNTLYTRIENSKIALAVFSKRYCESEWCLNELAKMSEEMKERKLMVIPIFYNVTANDVKRACNLDIEAEFKGEEGEFTILFKKMKEKHANDNKLVKRWELALKSVTQRIGLSTEVYRNSLIQSIVREVRRNLGMPQQKTMSVGDVSLWALWTSSVFAFIIAPLVFPNVNFFKTGKWVLGFPLMVLLWYTWDIDKRNTPLSFIRQRRRSTIWDRQNQNTPPAVNRQRRHCRICDSKNQNTQPAFDWKPRHCRVCDREKQNRQPAFVGQPRPPRITFSVVQHL